MWERKRMKEMIQHVILRVSSSQANPQVASPRILIVMLRASYWFVWHFFQTINTGITSRFEVWCWLLSTGRCWIAARMLQRVIDFTLWGPQMNWWWQSIHSNASKAIGSTIPNFTLFMCGMKYQIWVVDCCLINITVITHCVMRLRQISLGTSHEPLGINCSHMLGIISSRSQKISMFRQKNAQRLSDDNVNIYQYVCCVFMLGRFFGTWM